MLWSQSRKKPHHFGGAGAAKRFKPDTKNKLIDFEKMYQVTNCVSFILFLLHIDNNCNHGKPRSPNPNFNFFAF
jgi:hypothetical protein